MFENFETCKELEHELINNDEGIGRFKRYAMRDEQVFFEEGTYNRNTVPVEYRVNKQIIFTKEQAWELLGDLMDFLDINSILEL